MASSTVNTGTGAMDNRAVGARIATRREAKGLTQRELAELVPLAKSSISMIERGLRRASDRTLALIAKHLDCALDDLLVGPDVEPALDIELRFAEFALREGDAATAIVRFSAVRREALIAERPDIAAAALYGLSVAYETTGDMARALAGVQELADDPALPATVSRTAVLMMLCRTYLACGALSRAIEVGEAALRDYRSSGLPTTEKTVELAVTLVLCHYERGDITRALILIRWAMAEAEALGTPRARASAYWNAAIVAHARGDLREARRLNDRARAIFGELDARRSLAMVTRNAGWLTIMEDPRAHSEARALLESALAELLEVGGPGDAAEAEADLARCHLAAGDVTEAVATARRAAERASGGAIVEAAKVRAVLADVLFEAGETAEALATYRGAAEDLERVGASRHAAGVWRQLATALRSLGDTEGKDEALERALDAGGIPAPPASRRRDVSAARAAE